MESNNTVTDGYCQQKHINNLDALADTMKDIKQKLQESCLQAHLLHVDLATQFNPFRMKTVQEAQESCERCKQITEDNNTSSK